jgi:hypothetical protein
MLFPERFTADELRAGVDMLLVHVPAHILAAARLGEYEAWYVAHALACVVGLFIIVGVVLNVQMKVTHRIPDVLGLWSKI